MGKIERWLSGIFLALLILFYGHWLFTATAYTGSIHTIAGIAASMIACLLFGLLGITAINSVLSSWCGQVEINLKEGLGRRSLRLFYRHPFWGMFIALVVTRLLVFAIAYAIYTPQAGYEGGLLDTLGIWIKGDAPHYLGIAENWYVTSGDPRFHIVFFPFYPICVRLLNLIVQNTLASGMICSFAFTVGSCLLLYELAILDMDRDTAKRAVKYQLLLPAAFLLSAPMSDSLFLMLSIACMLAARKKHYGLACLMGGLASFTRVLGVITLVPVLVELLGDARRVKLKEGSSKKLLLTTAPFLFLIPAGLLLYLYINYNVTGNAFTFMIYQREHWSQSVGWFFNTAAYQTDNFLGSLGPDNATAFGLWLPNLIYLLGAPLIMLGAAKLPRFSKKEDNTGTGLQRTLTQPYTIRASYLAYFLAYYAVGMGATWLLSAPRYLTCCFPLPLAMAAKQRSRTATFAFYAVLFAMQVFYIAAYVWGWPVY